MPLFGATAILGSGCRGWPLGGATRGTSSRSPQVRTVGGKGYFRNWLVSFHPRPASHHKRKFVCFHLLQGDFTSGTYLGGSPQDSDRVSFLWFPEHSREGLPHRKMHPERTCCRPRIYKPSMVSGAGVLQKVISGKNQGHLINLG